MHGSCNYIPETNRISKVYGAAAYSVIAVYDISHVERFVLSH
jgi:hypothetical protein